MPKKKIDGLIQVMRNDDCYTEQTFFKFTQGDLDALFKKAGLSLAAKRGLQEHWETQWMQKDGAGGASTTKFKHKVAYIFWQSDYSKLRQFCVDKCGMS